MRIIWLTVACLALAGCSKAQNAPARTDVGAEAAASPAAREKTAAGSAPVKVSVPKMAYAYKYAFSLPGAAVTRAQQAHVALCDRLGPARCQVLALESQAGDEHYTKASLKLRVESGIARQFGAALEKAVGDAGGRAVDHAITAEDVSKDMVDTEARIHQRELLVARLTDLLRTRNGTVAELVEAERSVAAAQEELDQAKGWLTELQGRVAMSIIDVDYNAVAASSDHVGGGVGDAIAASASTFIIGLGAILRFFIFVGPWAILGALGWWGWRRLRTRFPRSGPARSDEIAPPS
ncbi:MAG: DUF4349 domain-containing protein [Sphingomonas sp.]